MTPNTTIVVNPLQPLVVDIEHIPLADIVYKIFDPIVEFNLLDIHNWCFEKYLDKEEEIHIWESNFPKYVVPLTHPYQEIIRLCHQYYIPKQRAIVNANKEVLFTITAESINQMLQLQSDPQAVSLSIEALTKLYINLDFPKRFMIFQTFMPMHVEIPKLNLHIQLPSSLKVQGMLSPCFPLYLGISPMNILMSQYWDFCLHFLQDSHTQSYLTMLVL